MYDERSVSGFSSACDSATCATHRRATNSRRRSQDVDSSVYRHRSSDRRFPHTPSSFISLILATVTLAATVSGSKNNLPKFSVGGVSELVVTVKEGPESLGKILYRLRGEDADGDQLTFGALGPDGKELLRFERKSKTETEVYLKKELDREVRDSYTIVLTLTDGRLGDGQFIHQTLVIIVDDVNDNEPVFKAYRTSHVIAEGAPPQLVDTLEATDRDQGPFGQVVYQLQNTDAETLSAFKLQQQGSQARISLVGQLDYERKFVYELRVLAIDRARQGPRHTATAVVIVKVEDLEDQPPVFTQVPAVTRIPEDLPVGAPVLAVKAQDGDRGIDNEINYRIRAGNHLGLFSIDERTGIVTTSGRLDREATEYRNGAFILQIEASEVGSAIADSVARTEVTIVLTDVNDETPTFRSPVYYAEIIENAQINAPITFLGNATPEVFDHDQGTNGTFRLMLDDPEGTFEVSPAEVINEASFVIRVRRPQLIDFEQSKVIRFNLIAKEVNDNPRSSTAEVTVYVRDANDNFPLFLEESYKARVREDAQVGTVIARVQAEDLDSELFGTVGIRYTSIRGPMADKLRLDAITGEVSVATNEHGFDRESVPQFLVTVEARDELGKGSRNTVQLEVVLEDVNDNPPLFDLPIYEARLKENDIHFSNPLVVHASDADKADTPNSAIRYQLLDYVSNFTVNEKTGEIAPRTAIDFESIPQARGDIRVLVLTVRAIDAGQPPLASNTTVKVFVLDANDNAPVFLQNFYSQAIPEDIREGSSVVRVEAVDADDSPAFSKIAYRIETGAQDKFVIDAMSGIISVAPGAYLDPDRTYPKSKLYSLTIVALDGGLGDQQMWAACQVNISIIDVNNKPPTLRPPGVVHIMEDMRPGEEVGQLVATDPDDNPDLSYSLCTTDDALGSEAKNEEGTLVPFNTSDTFRVDLKGGKVYLRQQLDREMIETIKVCVQVIDEAGVSGDQLSQAILNIKVGDVNDNVPVFRKPFYREAVTENSKIGSPVVTARATDVDKNRSISYSLEGPPDLLKLISIDRKTGEVLVSDKIDRETTSWINVTLKATDSGVPPLTGMTSLSIQVLDENDNNPVFVDGPTEFHVSEDSPLGTIVAQLKATDADAGEHGRITYALDPSGTHGKFKIDKDTGIITVAAPLDREDIPQFTLIVQAWDNYEAGVGTDQSRRSFRQTTIHLSDVNDERPVFARQAPGECAEVSEFLKAGETVLMVSATDKDEPGSLNSRLVFSMDIDQPENDVFDVETLADNQARILTKGSVRGKVGNYSLTLRARDQGFPILNAMERFNVCVQDVNDHAPVFIKPPQNYTIRIPENATIGTVVVEVLADDEDHGANAQVRYRLKTLQNNHWRSFAVDELTGVVTLRAPLDRETQKVYELRVEASDQGTPTALTSDLDLTIYVTDVNDYAPEFTQDVFQLTFTENMSPGQEMYKLLATVDRDDDFGQNKPIPCYYIVGGNEDNRFSLDIFTHQLVATEVLDREERAQYSLVVQASDDCFHQPRPVAFDPKDNSLLQVDIKVLDVNDNPPRFISRVFTGGVTTEANFGTTFMRVQAIDIDQGENSRVSYFLEGEVRRTLSEGLDPIQGSPFVLDRHTGDIALNFYPQRGMKGYFDFRIIANDSEGLFDTATVYIYLLREDQRVRFVLRLTPDEFKEKETEFRMVMANITGAIVNIDEVKVHENDDGTVDRTKSDIYLHFVNRDDNTIMEVMTAISLIDQNSFFLDKLFKDFNVLHSEPAEVSIVRIEDGDPFKTWLMGVVVFLTVMLVLVISLCVAQKKRYQRQLKAATVAAFGTSNSGSAHRRHDLPNTNQHSVEGSNPIWMHSYDNEWFHKDDEDLQRAPHSDSNSLDENAVADQDQDHIDEASGSGSDRYSTSNLVNDRYMISPQSRSQAHTLQKTQTHGHGKAPAPPIPVHGHGQPHQGVHQGLPPTHHRNNFNTVLDVGVDYSHIFNAKMGTPNRLGKLEVSEL